MSISIRWRKAGDGIAFPIEDPFDSCQGGRGVSLRWRSKAWLLIVGLLLTGTRTYGQHEVIATSVPVQPAPTAPAPLPQAPPTTPLPPQNALQQVGYTENPSPNNRLPPTA